MIQSIVTKLNLIKTSLYSSISTVVRIVTSFVVNKVVAVYIGPAGLAIAGNFQNFINMLWGIATSSVNSGVVKYTAEYAKKPDQLKSLFSTTLKLITYTSLVIGPGCIVFNKYLSRRILHSDSLGYLFILFGISILLFALNTMILAILNGRKEIPKFTLVNIISSVASLIITVCLVYFYRLPGALLSMVLVQIVVFFIAALIIVRCDWFSIKDFRGKWDKAMLTRLLKYSAMGLTSAIVGPLSLLLIRNFITKEISVESAGYWEGINRLSSVYLLIFTTSLSVYFMPKLAETVEKAELRRELSAGYRLMIPVLIIFATVIYFSRFLIIKVLFSGDFSPMEPLFLFQLLGDILKISSFLLAYIMLAKAMTKIFILTELIFSTSYVLLTIWLLPRYGLIGVTYAYFINYCLYLLTCFFLFRKRFF